MYPLAFTESAWKKSNALVVETNLQGSFSPLPWALAQKEEEKWQIDPSNQKIWQQILQNQGIQEQNLRPYRTWFLAMILSQWQIPKLGLQTELGIDLHFIQQAHSSQKKTLYLEKPEYQIERLSSISAPLAQIWVNQILSDWENTPKEGARMLQAWKEGNCRALLELDQPTGSDKNQIALKNWYERELLQTRNERMADSLNLWSAQGIQAFVVVGSAHLCGEHSLLELLTNKGWKVINP